jgi:hypothetical protein
VKQKLEDDEEQVSLVLIISVFIGFVNKVYLSVLDGSGFETTPQSPAFLKDLHIPGKSCFQCNLKRKTLMMTSRQIKKVSISLKIHMCHFQVKPNKLKKQPPRAP